MYFVRIYLIRNFKHLAFFSQFAIKEIVFFFIKHSALSFQRTANEAAIQPQTEKCWQSQTASALFDSCKAISFCTTSTFMLIISKHFSIAASKALPFIYLTLETFWPKI